LAHWKDGRGYSTLSSINGVHSIIMTGIIIIGDRDGC
jgi:hypothetical protein